MLDGILDDLNKSFALLRENAPVIRILILFAVVPILINLLGEFFKDGLNMIGKSPWFSSNCEISDADECADDGDDELWNPFDGDDDDYDSD